MIPKTEMIENQKKKEPLEREKRLRKEETELDTLYEDTLRDIDKSLRNIKPGYKMLEFESYNFESYGKEEKRKLKKVAKTLKEYGYKARVKRNIIGDLVIIIKW